MKKVYITPEIDVVEAKMESLLADSPLPVKPDEEIENEGEFQSKPHHGYLWDWDDNLDDKD